MDLHLKDKNALVTGGSRGLGRAICEALAEEGANVIVNCRSRIDDAHAVAEDLQQRFGRLALAIQADIANEEDVAAMFDRAEAELGPIDVLVNNAGTWPTAYVKDMTRAEWDETIAANLTGSFLTCREAVKRWVDSGRGGRIVNVTSQAAHHGATSGHAHYAAAKAGLSNFTNSLAREVAEHGICVNAVAPGVMPTDMIRDTLEKNEARYLARIPLRRWGEPREIAAGVLFLASDQASYITGATLDVNGGMVMR